MNQSDNTNQDGSNAVDPMTTTNTYKEQPTQETNTSNADEGPDTEQPPAVEEQASSDARASFNVVRRASYVPGDTVVTRSNKNAYCGSILHMDGDKAVIGNAFDLLGDSGLEVEVPTTQIVAAVEGEPRAIVRGDLDDLGAPQPGTDEE